MISHKLNYTFSEDCTLSFNYEPQVVGVEVDFTTMTYTRLNYLSDDFSNISPYKDMRRCNIKDGILQCYLGENGYKEDGSNGDVMVEIPKFYYKVIPLQTEQNSSGDGVQIVKGQWYICDELIDGFKVHPAFVRNNVEVDYIYISAYEGSLYDISEDKYILDDAQVADFNTDKLVSIANAKPISGLTQNLTITNAEKLCTNKGTNYLQFDFTMASGLQLLMLIEYCTFDIQSKLGNGVVNITDDGSSNMSLNTGNTSSLNNLSGYNGTNGISSISYHGIENLYGNIWKFISGLNIYNYSNPKAYWSNDDKTVNTSEGFNEIGFNLCTSNGYISRIGYDEDNDFVFLPTKVNNSNNIKDYYYQDTSSSSWTIARLGGSWNYGSNAGTFCWTVCNGSGARFRDIGCRLAFFSDNIVKDNVTKILIDNTIVSSDVNIVEGNNKLTITPTITNGKILSINKNGKINNIVLTKGIKEFDYFNGIQSTFEENLVTDENNPNYGKYRVIYRTKSSDGNASTVKSIYLNSPLLQGDKLVVVNGKLCHYHKMGMRTYEEGDLDLYITDLVNTVYELTSPYYEEISSNPKDTVVDFYANGTLEVQSAVYPLSMEFTSFEEELTYLYTSTVYTVQFEANGSATVNITLGGATVINQAITHGINKIQITTPSTLVDNKLIIDGCGDCKISKIVVTNSTEEFEYFEGMKSAFEDKQNEDGTYTVEIVVYNAPIRLNKDEE